MINRFDRFTSSVSSIMQSISRIKKTEMQRYGLRSGHVDCLRLLYEHPKGLTSRALSELSDMDKAAVSRYMDQLEEVGFAYIDEDEDKKYKRRWVLSERGMETGKDVDRKIEMAVSEVGDFLADEERELLYKMLEQIDANLKKQVNASQGEDTEA